MISNPREFVEKWLAERKIVINERGILCNDKKRNNADIIDTIILDYHERINDLNYSADRKMKLAPDGHIQKAVDELISLNVAAHKEKIIDEVKFSGHASLTLVEKFVLAMTGKVDPVTVGVLAHFLWTIKRRMIGKEVVFHIMPIILGKQESGKSYSVKKLLSPIKDLFLEMPLDQVTDSRNHLALSSNFAIILNEMAGADKTDVDKLKNLITTEYNDVRKLHTNTVIKAEQNASLIGTTNKPVAEIIYDPTGARRFYEIKSQDVMDWGVIKDGIDYLELWRGINETKERGYYEEYREGIRKNQAHLTGLEELQVFLELKNVRPGNKEIDSNILYSEYRLWCDANGVTQKKVLNSVWLGRKLTGKGFTPAHQKRVRGKNTSFYMINEDCELHERSPYDPTVKAREFL